MANKTKYFDLHFEIGLTDTGEFYAKTVLGINGGILFQQKGNTPAAAISNLGADLEVGNIWNNIAQNPAVCVYPFPGPQAPTAATSLSADPNAPKKKPSELSSVAYPSCQAQCTSFDHFGAKKCKSMCRQRRGV